MTQCPCCSGKEFSQCCEPVILGIKKADTAEEMMRSRYTAYSLKNIDYVLKTTHPDKVNEFGRDEMEAWANAVEWQFLDILNSTPEGIVEFKAKYKEAGATNNHHEVSTFKEIDGEWFFYDSEYPKQQTVVNEQKVGRNEPCPCGSGKKYKKCCGKK